MSFIERVDTTIRRSVVWRSLFRNPYPTDERSRAYAVMNNVFLHLHPVRVRQHAVRFAYTFCLGGLSFFLFLVLVITGVYLMFYYVPSATMAYSDILNIQSAVTFGLLTRNVHRWAAHLMVFFVFLHMMRVFYHGAYKPPREFNWVVGVVLLVLTLLLSFTGYLLPWDQLAVWAITVGSNMARATPFLGHVLGANDAVIDRAADILEKVAADVDSLSHKIFDSAGGGFLRQGPGDQQAPIPPAPPRRLVPAKPSPEIADKTSLLDLTERICKWPMGHPGEPDFHFCGEAVNPGFPYCVEHCGRAYQAQLPRGHAPVRCLRLTDVKIRRGRARGRP